MGNRGAHVQSGDYDERFCHVSHSGGVVHGGTLVSIADTMCGYGAITHLPEGATGFVTIELHTNFLGTATAGAMRCTARPVHLGKSTQVRDAVVCDEATERTLAIFRCTQMVLRKDR